MIRPRLLMFLGWVAVFATGCAVGAKRKISTPPVPPEPKPDPTPQPKPERKRYGVSFAVDSNDKRLLTAVQFAAKAWNEALGGEWVTVSPTGDVPVFWVDDVVSEECPVPANMPETSYLSGCAALPGSPDAHIKMSTRIPDDERLAGTVLHEVGHILRAAGGHIDDESRQEKYPFNKANIMNHTGKPAEMKVPTPDDVAFIREGMHYDYSLNRELKELH